MKLLRLGLAFVVTVLVLIALQQNGAPAAEGRSPLALVRGRYSAIFSGYVIANPLRPFAGTGLFIADGRGHVSGHETTNLNGHACDYQIKGTYTVNNDGTGTNKIDFVNGSSGCQNGNFTQSFSIANGGDLILLSNTNSPVVATEHWYREDKKLP
ncbi:MAG TPA: hypothetical protein VJ728_08590 [Candidatus Binataceae bacterium]|nr:hypothetical protein [Candidatus Binataceae bacterium]